MRYLSKPVLYGIIAGILAIVYTMLLYFIDKKMMLQPTTLIGRIGIYGIAMWFSGVAWLRSPEGDTDHLPNIIRNLIIPYLVANAIYWVFYYCLFNFIDPGLVVIQKEVVLDSTKYLMDDEQRMSMMRQLQTGDYNIYISNVIWSYILSAVGGFLLALLMAFALRKTNPQKKSL